MKNTSVLLFEKFIQIEDKYQLFDYVIGNEKIWQYVRFAFCAKMLEVETGIRTTNRSAKINVSAQKDIKRKDFFKKNQFLLRKKEMLVINHPRRVKEGNLYKCYVTDLLLRNMPYSYYVFEDGYKGMHYSPVATKGLKYRDISAVRRLYPYSTEIHRDDINDFAKKIFEIYRKEGMIFNWKDGKSFLRQLICNTLENIYYGKKYAEIILNLICPKVVILTVYYNVYNQALIAVAKRKGIPTVELQHGRIGESHAAYNFCSKHELEGFPDFICVYGKYEKDIPRYPIPNSHIYATGYPELEKKVEYYRKININSSQKVVTFISSPVEGEIIAKYAIELRKKFSEKDVKIIFKLHPSEYDGWREHYSDLCEYAISIVDRNEYDIYHYLGQTDYVVGISSTVLFEAIPFDANIIIIKEQDYTKCKIIYENKCALLIENEEELIDIIRTGVKINSKNVDDFYFESHSIDKMISVIRECMFSSDFKSNINYKQRISSIKAITKMVIAKSKNADMKDKDKELADKHLRLFLLMNQWVKIKQDGKRFDDYFCKQGYKNIAIYGMSYVGVTLLNELKGSLVSVKYGIDQNADTADIDIEVHRPSDKLDSVDAVIVTPIFYFDQIKEQLQKKINCPIISINQVLDDMEKGEY